MYRVDNYHVAPCFCFPFQMFVIYSLVGKLTIRGVLSSQSRCFCVANATLAKLEV